MAEPRIDPSVLTRIDTRIQEMVSQTEAIRERLAKVETIQQEVVRRLDKIEAGLRDDHEKTKTIIEERVRPIESSLNVNRQNLMRLMWIAMFTLLAQVAHFFGLSNIFDILKPRP